MRIFSDIHTHTHYSRRNHGKGSIRENAQKALEEGLCELTVTDHGPGHLLYGIDRKEILNMRREVEELNREFEGRLRIYLGVEANVVSYDGEIDLRKEELSLFDRINVGFHYGVWMRDWKSFLYFFILNPLGKVIRPLGRWMAVENAKALVKILRRYPIYAITHPGDKVPVDMDTLASQAGETLLEINASHGHLSLEELEKAAKYPVRFVVGSDAHSPRRVGEVKASLERVAASGIDPARVVNLKGESYENCNCDGNVRCG